MRLVSMRDPLYVWFDFFNDVYSIPRTHITKIDDFLKIDLFQENKELIKVLVLINDLTEEELKENIFVELSFLDNKSSEDKPVAKVCSCCMIIDRATLCRYIANAINPLDILEKRLNPTNYKAKFWGPVQFELAPPKVNMDDARKKAFSCLARLREEKEELEKMIQEAKEVKPVKSSVRSYWCLIVLSFSISLCQIAYALMRVCFSVLLQCCKSARKYSQRFLVKPHLC